MKDTIERLREFYTYASKSDGLTEFAEEAFNALPALLDRLEKLEAVVEAAQEHGDDTLWLNQGGSRDKWVESHNIMMDALAALET